MLLEKLRLIEQKLPVKKGETETLLVKSRRKKQTEHKTKEDKKRKESAYIKKLDIRRNIVQKNQRRRNRWILRRI